MLEFIFNLIMDLIQPVILVIGNLARLFKTFTLLIFRLSVIPNSIPLYFVFLPLFHYSQ